MSDPSPSIWGTLPPNSGRLFHTRVLKLQPAAFEAPIVFFLQQIIITKGDTSSIPFEAISYCWGDDSLRVDIKCDDTSISISPSLESALRYLRFDNKERVLWADAISINQHDLEEKAYQVQNMALIFSTATQVISWIGSRDYDGVLALKTFRIVANCPISHRSDMWRRLAGGKQSACTDFFRNQYFERIWVVQEVARSRVAVLRYSYEELPWEMLSIALEVAFREGSWALWTLGSKIALLRLASLRHPDQERASDLMFPVSGLSRQLCSFKALKSTDPRDKVFALLGLIHEDDKMLLPTNYRQDTCQLYQTVTALCVRANGNLDIFSMKDTYRQDKVQGLPSWAVDWSLEGRDWAEQNILYPGKRWNEGFCASGSPHEGCEPNMSILKVSGHILDCVDAVGLGGRTDHDSWLNVGPSASPEDDGSWNAVIGAMKFAIAVIIGGITESTQDIFVESAVWTAFSERCAADNKHELYFDTLRGFDPAGPDGEKRSLEELASDRSRERCIQFARFCCRLKIYEITIMRNAVITAWVVAILYFSWVPVLLRLVRPESKPRLFCVPIDRRFTWTTSGRWVNIPYTAISGDCIALLAGGRVPYVLRKVGDGKWSIVGDAYVSGAMYGEEWDESKCEKMGLV